jgi:FADH2 O2-dependent halogenase
MIARRLERSVLLVEKGTHPRIVIGESSTPLSNLLLEELAPRYDLPALLPLTKWGSWQRAYPQLACGLKRGFTFHHHVLGKQTAPKDDRQDQLLVAASPHDAIADTHWYRADFDHFLVRQAQAVGVQYVDQVKLRRVSDCGDTMRLEGSRCGKPVHFTAKFVVDATGPRGFLHRALGFSEVGLPGLPHTQALFNHFSGVKRLDNSSWSRTPEEPPYPIDNAAVHHIFDGGWIWVLQFNNGITSAGVAVTDKIAATLDLNSGARAWRQLLKLIPALAAQFEYAQPIRPFTHIPRLSFRSAAMSGDKWVLLPSAAGFVDPLLSTGFPLTLLGVSRLAGMVERDWGSPRFTASITDYAQKTDDELMAAAQLIGALYNNMGNFPVFISLSLLYFAAVSFSEAAMRLGKPHLASSFLLRDHKVFGPACRQLCERALHLRNENESEKLKQDILQTIEPFDVAGLGDTARRNWYPARSEDLLQAAHKLDAAPEDIQQLLRRCGFSQPEHSASLATAQP